MIRFDQPHSPHPSALVLFDRLMFTWTLIDSLSFFRTHRSPLTRSVTHCPLFQSSGQSCTLCCKVGHTRPIGDFPRLVSLLSLTNCNFFFFFCGKWGYTSWLTSLCYSSIPSGQSSAIIVDPLNTVTECYPVIPTPHPILIKPYVKLSVRIFGMITWPTPYTLFFSVYWNSKTGPCWPI